MSEKFTISLDSLESAVSRYALELSIAEIPRHYYEAILKTWNEMKQNSWDDYQAAAALVYAAVVDGFVHRSQMTPQGYRAYNWAEKFIHSSQRTHA